MDQPLPIALCSKDHEEGGGAVGHRGQGRGRSESSLEEGVGASNGSYSKGQDSTGHHTSHDGALGVVGVVVSRNWDNL